MSARIENGGHVVCLRDSDISEMKATLSDIHNRLFIDNGRPSIQSALISGDARFRIIEAHLKDQDGHLHSVRTQLSALADTIRQSQTLQNGMAGESLTVEGLVREVLKRVPAGGEAGSSHSAMWISLATACVCATIIIIKVWP